MAPPPVPQEGVGDRDDYDNCDRDVERCPAKGRDHDDESDRHNRPHEERVFHGEQFGVTTPRLGQCSGMTPERILDKTRWC